MDERRVIEFFTDSSACDVLQLEELLDEGLDLNQPMSLEDGRRPLHAAAATGNVHMVEQLLDHEANIDARDYFGNTPLHDASRAGHVEVVHLLLGRKADPNLTNDKGFTILESAVCAENCEITKCLLAEGVNVLANSCIESLSAFLGLPEHDFTGKETVLTFAFWLENLSLIQVVLEAGGDVVKESGTLMYVAVRKNNIQLVRLLLEKGVSIETKGPGGRTPLDAAISYNCFRTVEELLNECAEIGTETSLKLAITNGNLEISELLVSKGAILTTELMNSVLPQVVMRGDNVTAEWLLNQSYNKILTSTQCYSRCLYEAVTNGNIDMIHQIVNKGICVNWKIGGGKTTALILATQKKLAPVIKLLLDKEANIRLMNDDKNTAMYYAIAVYDSPVIFELFLRKGALVNDILNTESKTTALHLATRLGKTRVVEFLLGRGANVNAQDALGNTPFHELCQLDDSFKDITRLAKLLIEKGANMYCANNDGLIPLYLAIRKRNWSLRPSETDHIRLFLEEFFKVNKDSLTHIKPLLELIIKKGHIKLVKIVLNKLVRYYIKEAVLSNRVTCLQYSAYVGDMNMSSFALQSGGNIDQVTEERFTPLQMALYRFNTELAQYLINQGSNLSIEDKHGLIPIQVAFLIGNVTLVEQLCTKGPLNVLNIFKTPLLHIAVYHGSIYLVKYLLSKGCSINTKDEDDNSILHIAVEIQNHELVEFLLKNGIEKNSQNKSGDTALHISLRFVRDFNLSLEISHRLLEHDVDINIANEKKDTPLHVAWSTPLASVLLEKGVTNINAKNIEGTTALHDMANHLWRFESRISFDPTDRVVLFLKHGANIILKNDKGGCLMSELLRSKVLDIEKVCQEWKIDLNILTLDDVMETFNILSHDEDGQVVQKRQFALLQSLLNQRFTFKMLGDITFLNHLMEDFDLLQLILFNDRHLDFKILDKATRESKLNIIKIILDKVDINTSYEYEAEMFFPAVRQKYGLAQIFFDRVKVIGSSGNSVPLIKVAKTGNVAAVEILLNKGANINSVDNQGNTPLNFAIASGDTKLFHLLMDWDADVNLINDRNETCVHLAANAGNVDILKYLLGRGSMFLILTDIDGNTPLHKTKSYEVAKILIGAGISVNAQNSLKRTALHCINDLSPQEGYKSELNDTTDVSIISAFLIDKGALVNVQDKFGMTPLHLAAKNNDVVTMAVLVNNDGIIDLRDCKGRTALHYAVIHSRCQTIEYLLEEGAPPDIKDNWGNSPYRMCCSKSSRSTFDKYLVKEKLAGLPSRSYAFGILTSDEEVLCFTELEMMKCTKVDETFSLFDIFARFQNPQYLFNEKLMKSLKSFFSSGKLDQFPHYKSVLKGTLNKSKRKCYLTVHAIEKISDGNRDCILRTLPGDAWLYIFKYLSVDDISMLVESVTDGTL